MAARGTPLAELMVSDDEREILEPSARRPTTAQALALALRCRIVLACAEGYRTWRSLIVSASTE